MLKMIRAMVVAAVEREQKRLHGEQSTAMVHASDNETTAAIATYLKRAKERSMRDNKKGTQLTPAAFTNMMQSPLTTTTPCIRPFTVDGDFRKDIEEAIKRAKTGKAIGLDGVHN